MPMRDDLASDDPLPLFLSGHADEHEERGSLLLLNASILLLVASLVAMAIILLWGNPVNVFADVKASLTNISAQQPGTGQSTPTIPSALTASGAPTRNEIAAPSEPADPSQTEISEPTPEALFKQFQAWAADRAQVGPARPVQDASAQIVQDAPAPVAEIAGGSVQPMKKHRRVQHIQDARAESRPVQNPRPKSRP